MKKIWITALQKDEARVQKVVGTLTQYGMEAAGAFWEDNLENRKWAGPVERLKECDAWLILATKPELGEDTVRVGLSLVALSLIHDRGGLPIILAHVGEQAAADSLPTPLSGATIVDAEAPTLGATVTAAVFKGKKSSADYRLVCHPLPQGMCFEVGPAEGSWEGAIFGVLDPAEVTVQAVGDKGKLPEQTTLNYPIKDMKIELGERTFNAWATRNQIESSTSHYALVVGTPKTILFGPFPEAEGDAPELYILDLA